MADICFTDIQKSLLPILNYSGRYFMRIGNYAECVRTPGMDFNSVYFNGIGNDIAALYASFCLPISCTKQLIQQQINKILIQAQSDLRVSYIFNRIPQQKPQFTPLFFFTIFLITFLTLLVIFTSLSSRLGKNPILSTFNIKNSLKIFKYNKNSKLNVLNGVRSLAMFYVIFGHQYSLTIINTSNILSINQLLSEWKYLIIEAGILAVDVFFFVGGFLVAYSVLKQDKVKSKIKYILAILNRFLRFVPSYLMAILIYYTIMPHLVQGPFWYENLQMLDNCKRMWKALLFVDNLVDNGNKQCMGWGWYLQNDMQIFIYSLLILYLYSKNRFWSFIAILFSILGSFAFSMQQTFDREFKYTTHMTDFATYGDYMSDIYIKPWTRCPPYLFGLFLGIIYTQFLQSENKKHHIQKKQSLLSENQNQSTITNLQQHTEHTGKDEHHHDHHHKNQVHSFTTLKQYFQNNPWKRRLFQFTGFLITAFVIFIPRTAQGDHNYWPQFVHSIFLTYSKLLFVFGLTLIILPALIGIEDSMIRFVTDTKTFNFIAKISFWTYLIHLTIMYQWITSIKIDFYYAYEPLYGLFVATAVESMTVAFWFVMIVQVPFAGLQKIFMGWAVKKLSGHVSKTQKYKEKNQDIDNKKQNQVVKN